MMRSLVILFLLCCSCATSLPPADPSAATLLGCEFWTATNLRVFYKQYIYWENRLNGEILQVGTPLRLVEVNKETANLVDRNNNQYLLYWQCPGYEESFAQRVSQYLTNQDPLAEIGKLKEEERAAIQIGEIKRGMSKKMVLYSWGFPPGISSPLEQDTWIYWVNSWQKCIVYFDKGMVVQIVK